MALIKFLTDSAADIPADLARELGIQVLHFPIAMEAGEIQDGVDYQPEEFYRVLVKEKRIPTHAQLTPFEFEGCYQQAYDEGYTDLIYMAINAKGSATYCNALQARESFYEENPKAREKFTITVIDAGTYTMAYGWAVIQGARMAAAGERLDKIEAFMRDWIAHARILFVPLDLRFAKKSGRVSAAAAFMGDALGLKPVMTFENGESKVLTKVRGEKNVVPTIVSLCQKNRKRNTPYFLVRADNPEMAGKLRGACIQELKAEPELEYFIGGVIAVNAGPNLIGMIYREK